MIKTANTGHFTPPSLRRLHKTALLAGTVLFVVITASYSFAQALTSGSHDDAIADAITQADTDITYDANGRIVSQAPLTPAAPAIPLAEDTSGQRIGSAAAGRAIREGRENLPEGSVDGRGRTPFNADPFEPQGIRAGSFILRPSLDQGIRATNNADNSATGSSAILSETTLRLNARSDWASHLATLDASGIFEKNLSGQHVSNPRGQIDAALRLDLSDQTRLNFGLGYSINREDASDPNGISAARTRPLQKVRL